MPTGALPCCARGVWFVGLGRGGGAPASAGGRRTPSQGCCCGDRGADAWGRTRGGASAAGTSLLLRLGAAGGGQAHVHLELRQGSEWDMQRAWGKLGAQPASSTGCYRLPAAVSGCLPSGQQQRQRWLCYSSHSPALPIRHTALLSRACTLLLATTIKARRSACWHSRRRRCPTAGR